jgi:hypothetical protein
MTNKILIIKAEITSFRIRTLLINRKNEKINCLERAVLQIMKILKNHQLKLNKT